MNYSFGDTIDGKYTVTGTCSDEGGMGTVLFVEPLVGTAPYPLVLKICKVADPDIIQRFIREVRNMDSFSGNSRVIQIYDKNLSHIPPYFVMPYLPDGDLTSLSVALQEDSALQESVFTAMADCINELHSKGMQHRDIKPQNFLRDGTSIVVSDLGLSKEIGAGTTFTMSHEYLGTQGYIPPEFISDGFARADAPSDIFMLGKSIYNLVTGRDPMYMTDSGVHSALFHVLEKCCEISPDKRYSSIGDFKQGLFLAYDIILNRAQSGGKARQILSTILDLLHSSNQYNPEQIEEFITLLSSLPRDEQESIIYDLPREFYTVMSQQPVDSHLETFMGLYESFVRPAVHTFSYAETVAKNMVVIFLRSDNAALRAKALEQGVNAAIWANRFAAMDTCRDMVMSVEDDVLGQLTASIIAANKGTFLENIEPSSCKNDIVKKAIRDLTS